MRVFSSLPAGRGTARRRAPASSPQCFGLARNGSPLPRPPQRPPLHRPLQRPPLHRPPQRPQSLPPLQRPQHRPPQVGVRLEHVLLRIVVHSELLVALATPAEILATTGAKGRLAAGRSELAFKKSEMKTGKIRWTRCWTCALQRQVLFMKKVL